MSNAARLDIGPNIMAAGSPMSWWTRRAEHTSDCKSGASDPGPVAPIRRAKRGERERFAGRPTVEITGGALKHSAPAYEDAMPQYEITRFCYL